MVSRESPVYGKLHFNKVKTTVHIAGYAKKKMNQKAWVVMDGDNVVGCLAARAGSKRGYDGLVSCDDAMAVHPTARSKGAGEMLLREYLKWATTMQYDLITIGSSTGIVDTDVSRKFYEKVGFEVTEFVAVYMR